MKKHHDYLNTYCWHREIIADPYELITTFFSYGDIAYWRKLVKELLLYAISNKIYRKNDPGDVVFECSMLESLMNAVHIIHKEKKKSLLLIETSSLPDSCTAWDYLPHFLSQKECLNPYRVFTKFFKYQKLYKWKQVVKDILVYALIKDSEGLEINLLSVYFQLTKLVEAAHLVGVSRKIR